MYDPELILSWTPREYRAFLKGAEYARVDAYDLMAMNALFNRKAKSKKIRKFKDIFDLENAYKLIKNGGKEEQEKPRDPTLFQKATASLISYFSKNK